MGAPKKPTGAKYRPTKPIPFELRQHCGVYFEEQLRTVASRVAIVPSPEFLALAATFVVHPSTTTRAKTREDERAAGLSLQLLRLTNSLVGPIAAGFDTAFAFTHFTKSRSGAKRLADNVDGETNEIEALNFDLAQRGSLWSRAEDFWHVVGWAFNCAVLHPNRWPRWKLLLEFLCEVLEADWEERLRRVKELEESDRKAARNKRQTILCGSLIYKYFKTSSGVSSRERRMMRAIFADGTSSASNEFREIFHNELKELEKESDKPKKREERVNVDDEIYGDYFQCDPDDQEESDSNYQEFRDELPSRPKRQRRTKTDNSGATDVDRNYELLNKSHSESLTLLGDLEALALRQRLLAILSAISAAIPEEFMHIDELYLLYVDFMRHLPLPIFQLFVSPSVLLNFPVDAQITLCEMLLERLRENKKSTSEEPYLSQHKMETYFLPCAASTSDVIDNARMSILLESVLRMLSANGLLHVKPSLKAAVEEGILARGEKAQSDTKKGQSKMRAEEFGWTWLIESGERLTYLVERVIPNELPAGESHEPVGMEQASDSDVG
ncbi:hypothetical protein PRK78_006357 [Emydomyces testavorans]|uniref:Uncharacterized protein n=1 Tax=Emydomyces testavorans TaxID=2070801 RepID=A0AAF0INI7_9EURO|nr:hypothetical protein PRK78_006357 [Emydomyces testavorans]